MGSAKDSLDALTHRRSHLRSRDHIYSELSSSVPSGFWGIFDITASSQCILDQLKCLGLKVSKKEALLFIVTHIKSNNYFLEVSLNIHQL